MTPFPDGAHCPLPRPSVWDEWCYNWSGGYSHEAKSKMDEKLARMRDALARHEFHLPPSGPVRVVDVTPPGYLGVFSLERG